jgi:cytochrome c biogenesis protein CcmG, thiol:disulfide interchange protein DsbE
MNLRRASPYVLGAGAAAVALIAAEAVSGTSDGRARTAAPQLPAQVLMPPRASLASLHGRPVMLNFWASWCPPCRREAPELARLSRRLGPRAALVGVDWNDGRKSAQAFVTRYHWTFPNLRDSDGEIGNRYGISGLPTTFILDGRGEIVRRLVGPQTASGLMRTLAAVT